MAKYHVNVTQDDINKGVPLNPNKCALALAVKRATKNNKITANSDCFRIRDIWGNLIWEQEYSSEVSDFRHKFDNYEKVSPIEFDLAIPESLY